MGDLLRLIFNFQFHEWPPLLIWPQLHLKDQVAIVNGGMFIELECSPSSSASAGQHVTPDGAEDLAGLHGAINISPRRGFFVVPNSPANMSHTPCSAAIRVISNSPPKLPNPYSLRLWMPTF